MLVVISDLHLTDGTATSTLHPGAMHLFIQQMRDLAERAGWRLNGRYQPIDRLDLVLLGDTFDIINSNRWLETGCRPYGTSTTTEISQVTADIVDEILRHNQPTLQLIRALVSDEIITVAPASQQGQPMTMADGIPVAVRTHYVVGNRDWMLRLKGSAFDLIRQRISHHLGLATPYNKPFPHDVSESDELLEVLRVATVRTHVMAISSIR
jgi:UDP-2,3-diacylglucosamine pyrophosphatase LpxH